MLEDIREKLIKFKQLTQKRIIKILKNDHDVEHLKRKYYLTYRDIAWCLINNKEFKTRRCIECGKILHIKEFYKKEFPLYCSHWCLNHSSISLNKRKQTIKDKYGADNVSKLDSIKKKKEETLLKHYGVKYGTQNNLIKEKIKRTNLKKYGTEYTFQSELVKEKIKKTNLEKYGHTCALKNPIVKEKQLKTNLDKYGVEVPIQNKDICLKVLKTRQQKYGTTAVNINHNMQVKVNDLCHEKAYTTIINNQSTVVPLFSLKDYKDICHLETNKYKRELKWKCLCCDKEFIGYYANGKLPVCPFCKIKNQSTPQMEISEFLKNELNLKIELSTRSVISPYELDIYIPDLKLAIEFNGNYWHSVEVLNKKDYHLMKSNLCEEKGIHLIHIWEYEYTENKSEIFNWLKAVILNYKQNKKFDEFLFIKNINGDLKLDISKFNLKTCLSNTFEIIKQIDCQPHVFKNTLTVFDCGCYILKRKI